jgi:hypothetical protein
MYYSQATIDNLLEEHMAIRGHLNLVLSLTREWKAVLNLKEAILENPTRMQEVVEKRNGLRQAMGYLEDGLKNHHIHEDEVLPSLVGDLLMRAIRKEHNELLHRFNRIDEVLLNEKVETFFENGNETLQHIDDLCGHARAHSLREDGILYFLKRLPEFERQQEPASVKP